MKLYNMLKTMPDEYIDEFLDYEINYLEERDSKRNHDTIGYNISYNNNHMYLNGKLGDDFPVPVRCFHTGYIPRGTRIVYGYSTDSVVPNNGGMYYYVDDDSYIYDFCKYIKTVDVLGEVDFFENVLMFLDLYLGTLNERSREEMFQMLMSTNDTYIDPVVEHKLSDFRLKGNAMCSEYSVMANNILSVFGFETYTFVGQEKRTNKEAEWHAFNMISFDKNNKKKDMLVDFADAVKVYDFKNGVVGTSPYIINIDCLDGNFIKNFIHNEMHLTERDYFLSVIGRSIFKCANGRTRDYFVDSKIKVKNMSSEGQNR